MKDVFADELDDTEDDDDEDVDVEDNFLSGIKVANVFFTTDFGADFESVGTLIFKSFNSLFFGTFGSFNSRVLGLPFLGILLMQKSSRSIELLGSNRDLI